MAGRGHARHIREQQLVFWTERGSSYRGHCGRLLLGSDPASAAPQTSAPPTWMEEHYSRPWRQVGSSGEAVLCDHPTPATVGGRSGDGGETRLPARGCRWRLPPTSSLCPRHLLGRWHFWDSKINATSSKNVSGTQAIDLDIRRLYSGVSAPEGKAASRRFHSVH